MLAGWVGGAHSRAAVRSRRSQSASAASRGRVVRLQSPKAFTRAGYPQSVEFRRGQSLGRWWRVLGDVCVTYRNHGYFGVGVCLRGLGVGISHWIFVLSGLQITWEMDSKGRHMRGEIVWEFERGRKGRRVDIECGFRPRVGGRSWGQSAGLFLSGGSLKNPSHFSTNSMMMGISAITMASTLLSFKVSTSLHCCDVGVVHHHR